MSDSEIFKMRESKKISHLESKVENLELDVSELKNVLKTQTEFGNRIVEILAKMDEMFQDARLKSLMKKYGPSGGAEDTLSEDETSDIEDELQFPCSMEDDHMQAVSEDCEPSGDHTWKDRSSSELKKEEGMEDRAENTDRVIPMESAFHFDRATPDSQEVTNFEGIRH